MSAEVHKHSGGVMFTVFSSWLAVGLSAVAMLSGGVTASAADTSETPHLAFVTEYIRELAAIENIRAAADRELQQDPKVNPFSNMIHTSTLFQLELRSQIAMLRSMKLNSPSDQLIVGITTAYERKVGLWQRMTEIGTEFMTGPREGVDYKQLAAELPQIRAELDFIDQTIFEVSPAVFATLIDLRPDSKNHASHLVITKAEKSKLLSDYSIWFPIESEGCQLYRSISPDREGLSSERLQVFGRAVGMTILFSTLTRFA
jgi:hypothetical protein